MSRIPRADLFAAYSLRNILRNTFLHHCAAQRLAFAGLAC
jgi:hypothetical protein